MTSLGAGSSHPGLCPRGVQWHLTPHLNSTQVAGCSGRLPPVCLLCACPIAQMYGQVEGWEGCRMTFLLAPTPRPLPGVSGWPSGDQAGNRDGGSPGGRPGVLRSALAHSYQGDMGPAVARSCDF